MKKIKFKKIVLNLLVCILIFSIISMFGYSIYEYNYKNTSDYYDPNSNIENLIQPKIDFQQEQKIVKDGQINLEIFSNIIKQEVKYPITKYNIEVNDLRKPNKIRIHYWTKYSNGYWYYSLSDI